MILTLVEIGAAASCICAAIGCAMLGARVAAIMYALTALSILFVIAQHLQM